MVKQETSETLSESLQPIESPASTEKTDEATSNLMATLKIAQSTQAESLSNPSTVNEEEAAANKPKIIRKPRVPRIGAKFDLEYMP